MPLNVTQVLLSHSPENDPHLFATHPLANPPRSISNAEGARTSSSLTTFNTNLLIIFDSAIITGNITNAANLIILIKFTLI